MQVPEESKYPLMQVVHVSASEHAEQLSGHAVQVPEMSTYPAMQVVQESPSAQSMQPSAQA